MKNRRVFVPDDFSCGKIEDTLGQSTLASLVQRVHLCKASRGPVRGDPPGSAARDRDALDPTHDTREERERGGAVVPAISCISNQTSGSHSSYETKRLGIIV